MYWLWIPAVALLSVFFLALCWYFFSDYRCFPCPCHKKSEGLPIYESESSTLQYFLQCKNASVSSSPHTEFTSSVPELIVRPPLNESSFASYKPVIINASTAAPSAPPSTPDDSPTIRLTHGTKKLHCIIFEENGIPTLDLHNMSIAEARSAINGFLHRQRVLGSHCIQIITGRGLHSDDGIAKLKPFVRNMIIGEGLQCRESSKGGAYLVYF